MDPVVTPVLVAGAASAGKAVVSAGKSVASRGPSREEAESIAKRGAAEGSFPKWVIPLIVLLIIGVIGFLVWPLISGVGGVLGGVSDIVNTAAQVVADVWEGVSTAAKEVWAGLKDALTWLKDTLGAAWRGLSDMVSGAISSVKHAGEWVWKHSLGAIF